MGFSLTCEECGNEFEGKTLFVRCCSSRCRTRKWRRTEKGKACRARSNVKTKRPDINKVCELCKEDFITARKEQYLCSSCSGSNAGRNETRKRHRARHPERDRARDVIKKRIKRGVSLFKQSCEVCNESKAEAHHHDYSKPLDITWLCEHHHNLIPDF